MATFGKKEPIHMCTAKPPETNPMQCKYKAISPNGTVAEISLATGKAQRPSVTNTYAAIVRAEKKFRNWVEYEECDKCPDVPATLGANGASFEDDCKALKLCKACVTREALISTRQECKNLQQAEYGSQFQTRMDRAALAIESLVAKGEIASATNLPKMTPEQMAAIAGIPEAPSAKK